MSTSTASQAGAMDNFAWCLSVEPASTGSSSTGTGVDVCVRISLCVEDADLICGVVGAKLPSDGRSFLGRIRLNANPSSCAIRLILYQLEHTTANLSILRDSLSKKSIALDTLPVSLAQKQAKADLRCLSIRCLLRLAGVAKTFLQADSGTKHLNCYQRSFSRDVIHLQSSRLELASLE
jgi:hypothetical protein